ncbi:hypothetical protein V5F40_22950 [Xanthobacter sp. DSM 14520]|uniref:hypothetical protein n=1 Tax=Xanthobacter autotrophicus (strain ATCC BAA-1158 / Py2) TaxID=78245 RepID=UPI0037286757
MEREPVRRILDYPWVVMRIACSVCARSGQTRLARLAEKHGAECSLEELLDRIAWTCPYPRLKPDQKARKYHVYCGIYLPDLRLPAPRPPDFPGPGIKLVHGTGTGAKTGDQDAA